MIDLAEFWTKANIGLGLGIIAWLLFLILVAKFPKPGSKKQER